MDFGGSAGKGATHDVRNLFIADGSSLVTAVRNQPTCTLQALAYRAAEKMIEAAKI